MKVTSLLVFIALAAYLTVYIVHRASNPVRTALTVTASMSESAPMSGLVIRNELLINSREQYIEVTAEDGSKVAGVGGEDEPREHPGPGVHLGQVSAPQAGGKACQRAEDGLLPVAGGLDRV